MAVATGQPPAAIGAISAAGAFKGNAHRATFDGSLTALGTAMTGHVDATLGARPNINVNLQGARHARFRQMAGRVAGPAAGDAARRPAPTPAPRKRRARRPASRSISSALRAFDATRDARDQRRRGRLGQGRPMPISRPRCANGVFKIAKLTGQFYGGAVDFSGTVDASKNTLTVDLKGSLQGIYFGEMLRGTAGTNSFGNDNLTVAVDGKINVMDIAVQGQRPHSPRRSAIRSPAAARSAAISIPSVDQGLAGLRLVRHGRRQHLQHARWVSTRPCCRASSTTRAPSRASSRSPAARCRCTTIRCRARTPWP